MIKTHNIDNKGKVRSIKNIKVGECKFPFKYKNKIYNECVNGKSGDWCATELTKSRTALN